MTPLEQGYAVLEGAFSPGEVEILRRPMVERYEALGSPATWANPPAQPAADVEISRVGLVFHKLGGHFPDVAIRALHPAAIAQARAVLGADLHLEYMAAVLVRGERPFFAWHAHVGGVDNLDYRKREHFPRFSEPERITGLLYLDDLDDESGTLLVKPRRVTDDTRPPQDPEMEAWDGRVELRCRRGTIVLLEQCTWHAARAKRSAGVRAFIAFYLTSSRAPRTSWVDDSLRPFAVSSPLVASLLPRT